ncbi:CheR family methyltransferase [Salinibius halmophilus]|uniref:CheR family methyltransferase n=1 Tax=Salinibius halmophilus TaxID=1853216 RepID=UPI000E67186C|nr:protein-glutamate O-methyltransferase CheR [Salinibius halmophilus]
MTDVELSEREFGLFRDFIYHYAGVKLHDGKSALVSSRLHKRVRHYNLSSYSDYYQLIAGKDPDAVEQQLAIDLLTTNETYFYREPKHFDFLQSLAMTHTGSMRVWSAASSTGEEAYSIAMLLAVHKRINWEVVGTDISQTVLTQARRGVYPIQASDQIPQALLKKYCLKGVGNAAGTLRIDADVRQHVSFQHANLKSPQNGLGQFDVAFLRNVMIYFDQGTKQQVLNNVVSQVKKGGYLFIGHAESLNGLQHQLTLVQPAVYQVC